MFSSSTWSKVTLWKPLAQQYRDSGWLRGWQDLSFDPKLLREADAFEVPAVQQRQWRGCWVTCLLLLLRSKSIKGWLTNGQRPLQTSGLKPGSHLTTPRTLTWMPPYQQAGKQLWTHLAWQMVRNYLWNMRENHPYMLYYNPSSNLLWNKKPNQKRYEKPSLTSFWHITPAICII